jgi:hypothetical protein
MCPSPRLVCRKYFCLRALLGSDLSVSKSEYRPAAVCGVYEAVKFWYFGRYTVEHGVSSECVEGVSEIEFDDDVFVQQVFHVTPMA